MNLEPSRFSFHCTLIAVLALVAGIAVTVQSAAHHVGLRDIVVEQAGGVMVTLRPTQGQRAPHSGTYDHPDEGGFAIGEI